jgi:hypothetical protein
MGIRSRRQLSPQWASSLNSIPTMIAYGEQDFGAFMIGEQRLLWKIDYYDLSLEFDSNAPADPAQTKRVLYDHADGEH